MTDTLSFLSLAQRLGLNADQFDVFVKQMLAKTRVALPCIVQAFDQDTQTVSVIPAVMEKVYQNIDGVPTPSDLKWDKPFGRIPVIFPRAGDFSLTMPVQPGDECLVIFADYCTDQWCQSGGPNNAQMELRRHDLSDGFAILGPWSQPRKLDNYNTSSAELRTADGTVKITLGSTSITITGATTLTGNFTINGSLGFYDHAPEPKPTITGSKGGNAALASLLTALALLGLVTDSTT